MSRYHFARSGRGKRSREITKLLYQSPDGLSPVESHQVPQVMFDKYAQILKKNPDARRVTIQEFIGPELFNTLRRCPQEDTRLLNSPVLKQEIKKIIEDQKTSSALGPL